MNVLIVEDDPLAAVTLQHYVEKAEPGALCHVVQDGAEALRQLTTAAFDAVFLDLDLPGLDGPSVLKALPQQTPVVIVSAHDHFGARSYEFGVLDYLVKPLEFARFHRAWQKLLAAGVRDRAHARRAMVVRDGQKLVQIPYDRLCYLEAESNYTRFVCSDRSLLSLVSLKQLEAALPPEFLRVHRSYVVNTRFINQIEGATIFIGTHRIPIGETYRDSVLKRFAPLS